MDKKVKYINLDFLDAPKHRVGDDGSIWTFRCKDVKGVGRVWRWKKRKFSEGGRYYQVCIRKGKQKRWYTVAEIVLLAFVGDRPEGMIVRHFPDRNTFNNSLENVSWTTPKQNQQDRIIHGTDNKGERNVNHKLTEKDIKFIRKRWSETTKKHGLQSELARELGVTQGAIWHILNNRNWRHVA